MPLNKVDISMIEDIAAPGEAGKVLASDGTNWVSADAGELSLPTAGVDGQVLTSDGTDWASEAIPDPPVELPAAGADGQVLTSDGTDWVSEEIDALPAAGVDGQVLTSDGTNWASEEIDALPAVGAAGQVLTSNGTNWASAAAAVDLTAIRQDIAMLALYNAVSDNRAAYNLPFSFIDQFEDDTGLTTQDDVDRNEAGEYVASMSSAQIQISQSTGIGSWNESFSVNEQTTRAQDDNITLGTSGSGGDDRLGRDWGSGVTKIMSGFKMHTVASQGFNYGSSTIRFVAAGSTNNSTWVDVGDTGVISDITGISNGTTNISLLTGFTTTTAYRYHRVKFVGVVADIRFTELYFYEDSQTANPTGTLISDQQTVPSAITKMSGVVLVKDGGSSATVMGDHLKIYFCATGTAASFPSAWVEATSYTAVTAPFSTGVTMYKLGETTVPSGTNPTIRAVWASQTSGGFESQLHGWAMNY